MPCSVTHFHTGSDFVGVTWCVWVALSLRYSDAFSVKLISVNNFWKALSQMIQSQLKWIVLQVVTCNGFCQCRKNGDACKHWYKQQKCAEWISFSWISSFQAFCSWWLPAWCDKADYCVPRKQSAGYDLIIVLITVCLNMLRTLEMLLCFKMVWSLSTETKVILWSWFSKVTWYFYTLWVRKRPTIFFVHNFARCWPIFEILSRFNSSRNLLIKLSE